MICITIQRTLSVAKVRYLKQNKECFKIFYPRFFAWVNLFLLNPILLYSLLFPFQSIQTYVARIPVFWMFCLLCIFSSFRRFFHEKNMHNAYAEASARKTRFTGNGSLLTEKYLREWNDPRMGIRAAWYVNWDKQSLLSLKRNISHINLLMGECCSSIWKPERSVLR